MLSSSLRGYGALLVLALIMDLIPGWQRDSNAAELNAGTPRNDSSGEAEKPQIPTENFEWNGTFRVPGEVEPVVSALTIRGMWQNGYFNLYEEQGIEGAAYWVENLIYQNHLYTLTHNWPKVGPPVTGFCYKSLNPVTVAGLNGILQSAQLVGLETIEGTPMNHFRVSCLSKSQVIGLPPPAVTVNIFSDIYVQPNSPQTFERWLQFGDAVGLSKQHDEWFFFDEQNNHPEEIELPWQCSSFRFLVWQGPCSNLTN